MVIGNLNLNTNDWNEKLPTGKYLYKRQMPRQELRKAHKANMTVIWLPDGRGYKPEGEKSKLVFIH